MTESVNSDDDVTEITKKSEEIIIQATTPTFFELQ